MRSRLQVLLFCGLAALVATSGSVADAYDWAYWRGPEMNGVSRETGLIDDWSLEDGKNVLWTSDIGGRAAPIVLNDRVYLNCRTDNDVSLSAKPEDKIGAGQQVVCWDAKTGEVLWKDVFPVFQTDIPAPRVGWASPAGDPETGNVIVHTVDGMLICYTPDGERVWEHSLYEEYGKISGYGGRTTTPIIDEDRVIVSFLQLNWGDTAKPPPTQTFYAFDKRDGKLLWATPIGGAPEDTIYTNPAIGVIDGVRQLVTGNADGGCHGLNARTGEPLWSFHMSRRGLNASPVISGNKVYISHGEDNIDSIEFGRVQCIDATQRGDITETGSVWRDDGIKAGYTAPIIHDGILYVLSDIGGLHAYDAETGEVLWLQKIGTVGKGSPVWADGKIYVMEVNGRIWVLRPSREGCEVLSKNELLATGGQKGYDEIYASPAISNGRIFFVTRDRTICVGKESGEFGEDPIPPMAPEAELGDEIASLSLIPYETYVNAGDAVEYEVRAYDKHGRFLKTIDDFELTADDGLKGGTVDELTFTSASSPEMPQAGLLTATFEGKEAKARLRVFPPLPWKWNFDDLSGVRVPPAWVNGFLKLKPTQIGDEMAMKSSVGPGKPSFDTWLGPPEMSNYVIQADVRVEGRRRLSSPGITNQRYSLILKANSLKLGIQTWQAHLRLGAEMKYRSDPGKWYTLKLVVRPEGEDKVRVLGKVWPRDEEEPEEWTIEAVDPLPNKQGSPGLYCYRLADTYFDNVLVTEDQE
ncbi:outer membrane protein assembly factor BamB family protein [Stratiformator vulcanicus]|uniref:Outer membrane protein assembly factor BamB n=1 Tax=Stratiformator vulcanicus TaxID=2527980 RepID=A0A517R2V8_9PLAN|nr:PQQ-binding-like beta-propeller repeat protein [Stratiformator vulcanicus]QDT38212.1 Outer membrane protein assembly factor BamB precursor [Stratiformator vulcanicus]